MRTILDANVAIAAAAARGLCEAVVELCLERHQLILSRGILQDIEEKLRVKIKVSRPAIAEYLELLEQNAEMVEPEPVDASACRDPDDLKILGLVAPGKADFIISGDKDLLVVKRFKGARIITPRGFWEANTKIE